MVGEANKTQNFCIRNPIHNRSGKFLVYDTLSIQFGKLRYFGVFYKLVAMVIGVVRR